MTGLRKSTEKLNLRARDPDEVARPMPRHGDHKQVVESARERAYTKHPQAYRDLAKI